MSWLQEHLGFGQMQAFDSFAQDAASLHLMYEKHPLTGLTSTSSPASLIQLGNAMYKCQASTVPPSMAVFPSEILASNFEAMLLGGEGQASSVLNAFSGNSANVSDQASSSISFKDALVMGSRQPQLTSHEISSSQGSIMPVDPGRSISLLSPADPIIDFSPKVAAANNLYQTQSLFCNTQPAFPVGNESLFSDSLFGSPTTTSIFPSLPTEPSQLLASAQTPHVQTTGSGSLSNDANAMFGRQSLLTNIQPIFTTNRSSWTDAPYITENDTAFTPSGTPGRSTYNFLVWSPTISPRTPFQDSIPPSSCKWVTPPLPPLLDQLGQKYLVETTGHLPMDDGHWSELMKAGRPQLMMVLAENYLKHEDPEQWQARAAKNPSCRAVDNPRKYLTTNLKQKRDVLARRPEVYTMVQDLKVACPKAGQAMDGQSLQHICDNLKIGLAVRACGGFLAQALQADSAWEGSKKPKAIVLAKVKQFVASCKDRSRSSGGVAMALEDRAQLFEVLLQSCKLEAQTPACLG